MILKLYQHQNEKFEVRPDAMASAVGLIREQDKKQLRMLYVLVACFTVNLLMKASDIVASWAKQSTIRGMDVEVAFVLLSVVAIPILIFRIRGLRTIDYSDTPDVLVGNAIKRFKPMVGAVLAFAILLAVMLVAVLIADGQGPFSDALSLKALLKHHLFFLLGVLMGGMVGGISCYVGRRRFIRAVKLLGYGS